MDEYTSVRFRRHMNNNVHCDNDAINSGLVRMFDSCGAEKILHLLKKQLADFGITNMQTSFDSIVSDDASVMKTLAKISQLDYYLLHTWFASACVCCIIPKQMCGSCRRRRLQL